MQGGGNLGIWESRSDRPQEMRKNSRNIAVFFVREIAVGTLKNFGFPDIGQGKRASKIASPNKPKPSRKITNWIWAGVTMYRMTQIESEV